MIPNWRTANPDCIRRVLTTGRRQVFYRRARRWVAEARARVHGPSKQKSRRTTWGYELPSICCRKL